MDEWQVGDLALCIRSTDGNNTGRIFTVSELVWGVGSVNGEWILGLDLIEKPYPGNGAWDASSFRKITPPQPDEFDREVIDLMTRVPAHLDSEG